MAVPVLQLNCPRCGLPLTYVVTKVDGTHIYVCDGHQEFCLSPDGYLRGGVGEYGQSARPAAN